MAQDEAEPLRPRLREDGLDGLEPLEVLELVTVVDQNPVCEEVVVPLYVNVVDVSRLSSLCFQRSLAIFLNLSTLHSGEHITFNPFLIIAA